MLTDTSSQVMRADAADAQQSHRLVVVPGAVATLSDYIHSAECLVALERQQKYMNKSSQYCVRLARIRVVWFGMGSDTCRQKASLHPCCIGSPCPSSMAGGQPHVKLAPPTACGCPSDCLAFTCTHATLDCIRSSHMLSGISAYERGPLQIKWLRGAPYKYKCVGV